MNIIYRIFIVGITMFPISSIAQNNVQNKISLKGGFGHTALLDRQATPVIYDGFGYNALLGFERKKRSHYWQYELDIGKQGFQPDNKNLRYKAKELTAIVGGMNISYLIKIRDIKKCRLFIGPNIREDILIDFDGIGRWPYIFIPGSIMAKGRIEYSTNAKSNFSFELSLPTISWLTDMPFSQIPRVEGEYPGVASVFKKGTSLASWGRYQRVDVRLEYNYVLSNRLNIMAGYDWNWSHDTKPLDMWMYQGRLTLGMGYKFDKEKVTKNKILKN